MSREQGETQREPPQSLIVAFVPTDVCYQRRERVAARQLPFFVTNLKRPSSLLLDPCSPMTLDSLRSSRSTYAHAKLH